MFTISSASPPKSRVATCWPTHDILVHLYRKEEKSSLFQINHDIDRALDLACENDNLSHGLLSSR